MNSSQRENIRLSLLRHCDAAEQFALAAPLLLQFLRNEGFRELDAPALRAELRYLADKGLLATLPKTISPENEAWRITAAGRDFLATQNLEEL